MLAVHHWSENYPRRLREAYTTVLVMSWVVVAAIIGAGRLNHIRLDRLTEGGGPGENAIIRVDTVNYPDLPQPRPLNQEDFAIEPPVSAVPEPTIASDKATTMVPLPVQDDSAEAPTTTPVSRMFIPETAIALTPGTRLVIVPEPAKPGDDTRPAPATSFAARRAAQMPEALHDVSPEYPEKARALSIEGKVLLDMWLRKDGTVSVVQIFSSSGNELLDSAAARAALMCTFRPARNADGSAVNIWVRRQFTFSLAGGD